MKSTFLCEVFVLRLSDNVSHLGVFFGLLSAFSAGATYVVNSLLGTAKANEFVDSLKVHWKFNESSWMFWRLVSFSVRFTRFLLEHLAGRLGFSAACASIGSDRHLPFALAVSGHNWGHSGNEVWQLWHGISFTPPYPFRIQQSKSIKSIKGKYKICSTKKRWC